MAVTAVADWRQRLLARLYVQFKADPSWQLWCTDVLGPQFNDLEAATQSLFAILDIDSVGGPVLDMIGRLVGQPRAGVDDPTYRLYLKARIVANRSDGTAGAIYRVFDILSIGQSLKLAPSRIKAFSLAIGGAITATQAAVALAFLHDAKEAATRALLIWQQDVDAKMFSFAQATTVRTAAVIGNGTLAIRELAVLPASGQVTIDPGLATAETIAYSAIALVAGAPVMTLVGTLTKNHAVNAVVELVGDAGLGWGDSSNPATGGEYAGAAQA